jgi:hypothetical protein
LFRVFPRNNLTLSWNKMSTFTLLEPWTWSDIVIFTSSILTGTLVELIHCLNNSALCLNIWKLTRVREIWHNFKVLLSFIVLSLWGYILLEVWTIILFPDIRENSDCWYVYQLILESLSNLVSDFLSKIRIILIEWQPNGFERNDNMLLNQ